MYNAHFFFNFAAQTRGAHYKLVLTKSSALYTKNYGIFYFSSRATRGASKKNKDTNYNPKRLFVVEQVERCLRTEGRLWRAERRLWRAERRLPRLERRSEK